MRMNKWAKDVICVLLSGTFLWGGCAGRDGNPIAAYKPGDEKRDCISLQTEMAELDTEIARLLPQSDKTVHNAIMIGTGVFILIPLFFIDLKNGERVELQACRQRYDTLKLFAIQKGCIVDGGSTSQGK